SLADEHGERERTDEVREDDGDQGIHVGRTLQYADPQRILHCTFPWTLFSFANCAPTPGSAFTNGKNSVRRRWISISRSASTPIARVRATISATRWITAKW